MEQCVLCFKTETRNAILLDNSKTQNAFETRNATKRNRKTRNAKRSETKTPETKTPKTRQQNAKTGLCMQMPTAAVRRVRRRLFITSL